MSEFTLSFINNGKKFKVPKMTVGSHEAALDAMIQYGKIEVEKYNRLFNKQLILVQLKKIDKNVKLEDIAELHPDEYLDLFQAVWDSGRSKKGDRKFR